MEKPQNSAPTDLNSSTTLTFYENQPAGTFIGNFTASDPDANTSLAFSLQSGSNFFSLDANGTLRTLHSLDYETNSTSYTISVRVTDEHNASLDGNFTITLLNQVEDLDGDGIEDHYDPDDDGDGFSDATENAYGSDPRDPNSVANAAPNSLELNGTTILENQPAGTIIGRLSGTDPDPNATLSFSLVDENASGLSLDANGTLRALASLDYETNSSSYVISVRVTDEHNASLDGNFTVAPPQSSRGPRWRRNRGSLRPRRRRGRILRRQPRSLTDPTRAIPIRLPTQPPTHSSSMARPSLRTSLREPSSGDSPELIQMPTPPCLFRWSTGTPPVFPSMPTGPCGPSSPSTSRPMPIPMVSRYA